MTIKNIPVGYKDSPLGIIPMEWEVKRLGEIGTFYGGGTPSKSIDEYWHGDIPWISSADLIENDIYWCNINRFITLEAIRNSSTQIIPQNSILIVTRVGVGKVAVAPCDLCVSQDYICLQNSGMNTIFLAYEIMQRMKNIVSQIQGTSIKGISINEVKKIQLPLPPLAEQEKIAEILSTWDKAIEKQIQLIQKLELRKKGLMQQLLTGKKRLPGFTGEWEKVKINQCFFLISETNDGGSYLPMTISAKSGFVSQKKKFDRVIAGNSIDKYILLRKGDFAYNKGNSNLYEMGCIYQLKEESALVPFVYICFRAKEFVCGDFYQQYFLNHGLDRQLKRIITSGARGDGLLNVDKTDFFNLEIIYPTLQEQIAIANILSSCDKEIRLEQNKLVSMKEQKKGLMQVLLTGKRRVKL